MVVQLEAYGLEARFWTANAVCGKESMVVAQEHSVKGRHLFSFLFDEPVQFAVRFHQLTHSLISPLFF